MFQLDLRKDPLELVTVLRVRSKPLPGSELIREGHNELDGVDTVRVLESCHELGVEASGRASAMEEDLSFPAGEVVHRSWGVGCFCFFHGANIRLIPAGLKFSTSLSHLPKFLE